MLHISEFSNYFKFAATLFYLQQLLFYLQQLFNL